MTDAPAALDKATVAPPAETIGKGPDNKADTPNKGITEKVRARAKSVVSKLTSFMSSGNPEEGLQEMAATKSETSDTNTTASSPSAETGKPTDASTNDKATPEYQAETSDQATEDAASSTVVTASETTDQPEDTIGAMPENATAEDLRKAFDASPSEGQTELPQSTASPEEKTTQEKIADLKAQLVANKITQEEYTRLATEAIREDASPSSESATPHADDSPVSEDKPFEPEVPETADEVLETFKDTDPASDPIAKADAETAAKAREARRGTDERYQALWKQMLETDGDPTKMPIEDQRELVRYQEARLEDMREGLRAADGSVPIETQPTGPATAKNVLTKAGVTPEQLADILNSPQGEALTQAMQENPEQAQAILKEIAKAQEMQTQLKALCEANDWPFDAKQGMEFALGRIAAQLGNEMSSDDAAGAENSKKKWTILKVLLLALGIPLIIAAAAVAAEATLIQAGTTMARQAS